MCRSSLAGAILAASVISMSAACANAQQFQAPAFTGFEELGPLGAGETGNILSRGQGTLMLNMNQQAESLTYTLTYSGLSSNVTQAHIHFGRQRVPGGIVVFLCTNLGNAPAGTPACPNPSGTVSGMLTGASVIGPTAQAVTVGNFANLATILLQQSAYGNIHTQNFPGGEIRGNIIQCANSCCPPLP
jgi:CHRD domain